MAKYHFKINYTMTIIPIIASLMILGTLGHAFAQESTCVGCVQIPADDLGLYQELFPLTIWTDSFVYNHDSVVHLSGYLKPENTVHPVTLTVTNPVGNIVAIEQLYPNSDGSFGIDLNTSSPLWARDGYYIIKAQSGVDTRLFKTQIEITSFDVGDVANCKAGQLSVTAENGGVYCMDYYTTGETTGVEAYLSLEKKTLSLDIRSKSVAEITLEIPRYILDSKIDGHDADYGVFLNDEQADFYEDDASKDHRTIVISYPPDRSNKIDIVGTTVVPEFGVLASLMMVMGILTVVILGMRSRIS